LSGRHIGIVEGEFFKRREREVTGNKANHMEEEMDVTYSEECI